MQAIKKMIRNGDDRMAQRQSIHTGQQSVFESGSSSATGKTAASINAGILSIVVVFLLVAFVGGCVSLRQKGEIPAGEKVLAVVDGEPITEEDLKYSLQIAHRREDLSSAGSLSMSEYVQKLIDDMLLIEEARRMGMERDTQVQQAVKAYVLRESVVKLYDEEISQKVSVSDEEIASYYRKNYERFSLGIIEVSSEEEAADIAGQLKKGADFSDLARKYSTHRSGKNGGEIVITRRSMPPYIGETVAGLSPGELSDPLKIRDKYYIVRLLGRKEAPDEELRNVREEIEKIIRKQREKERADEYLEYLRKHAAIKVNKDILSAVSQGKGEGDAAKWSRDKRVVAEVNGSVLTAGEFASMSAPYRGKSKEHILNSWIDRKVVDHEALGRRYDTSPGFRKKIERYENQLLKKAFINKAIIPKIEISDERLKDYYTKHREEFAGPDRFRVQQITVKTMDEARSLLNSLQEGADFSWLARNRSIDAAGPKGGEVGWLAIQKFPVPVREIVTTLKTGEISPIVKIDSFYRIIRLQGRIDGEVRSFEEVRDAVYKTYFKEEFNALRDEFVARLRAKARIEIHNEAIKSLEEGLQK
ncbi:hypothetical protein MNBD_NITROSPIRAE02-976 [hydrothermal vent metagenome]|uniref:peptidylprolyl isomerase n=1 Tax=hydrothermal vent metagenome TaxID=652676 RepID=A0A3B1CN63_9ZZZZ